MADNYLKKELYELIRTDETIFDFIQEGSLDGLWFWDLENPENEWMNEKFWTVLGYNPDEMPHKSSAWQSIINQDDLKNATETFIKHCHDPGHPYDQVVRYAHKDGSTVWIRCRGMAIRDKTGKPVRMLGAHQNVTEFKESELKNRSVAEALRQSNDVVENIQIGLYIYHLEDINDDRTLRMKYANPATETMTGVKPADIIGKTLDENFPYLRDMNFPQRYAEVIRSGKAKTFEDMIYSDNRILQACFSVKAFPLSNNHLGIAFENITDKVASRQAVEQSVSRLKEAQAVGGIGSWEYDMTSEALTWSEQTYRIYGEEKDSFNVTFDNVVTHYPESDREAVLSAFNKAISERSELRIDHRIITGSEETRYVQEIGKVILSEEGIPLRMVGTVVDITERSKAEIRLKEAKLELEKRSAQFESSNKELEAFSYSVSHDLRAPLRHINGYVDMLSRRYSDELPEKARHYLDTISAASCKMGILIDDLLQYSRTGRQEVRKTEVDMNSPVKEVMEELKTDINGRKISWEINKLPIVYADHTLIRQVWANLLSNAVKYTGKKEAAEILVDYSEDDNDFVFCVSDNGDGFDMKYVHKLFGVFQRLHSETEFEGTGIGLANVQRIVHKHMGRVWAESEPGKGAKFYFTIPKHMEGKI